jgi:hypothetical protein
MRGRKQYGNALPLCRKMAQGNTKLISNGVGKQDKGALLLKVKWVETLNSTAV